MVRWLRLHTSNSGSMGLIPGQGTKIPYAMGDSQKTFFLIKKNAGHYFIQSQCRYVHSCFTVEGTVTWGNEVTFPGHSSSKELEPRFKCKYIRPQRHSCEENSLSSSSCTFMFTTSLEFAFKSLLDYEHLEGDW